MRPLAIPRRGIVDFATFSPTLFLDERAQTGSPITQWTSQAGAGFVFATGSDSPAAGRTIGGKAAPDFDGTNDNLEDLGGGRNLGTLIDATDWHLFLVMVADAVTGVSAGAPNSNENVIRDNGYYWGIGLRQDGGNYRVQAYQYDGSYRIAEVSGVALGSAVLVEAYYDGVNVGCRVGAGAAVTTPAGSVSDLTNHIKIGRGLGYFNGALGFVLAFDRVVSGGDVSTIRANLTRKYGVVS